MNRFLSKLKEWFFRYLPAEILGTISAIATGLIFHTIFHNGVITAISATIGENTGYYSLFVIDEFKKIGNFHLRSILLVLRNLLMEFGVGEYLDSLVVRPFAMYYFPLLLDNVTLGIVVGKIVADVVFYIPTIIGYELKKVILK